MIPLIDLSRWRDGSPDEKKSIAAELDEALRTSGFLMLSGHGIPPDLPEAIRREARRFFNLPVDAKRRYETTVGGRGWVAFGSEVNSFYGDAADTSLPDLKESYTIGCDRRTGDPRIDEDWFIENVWPSEVPELKPLCDSYADAVRQVYTDTLGLCAAALGLPTDWFEQRTGRSPHTFNINRYPPLTQTGRPAEGQFRIAPHTDWGVLTILDRQVGYGGLEVQLPEGDWVQAPHVPGAFTVNIGDLMARWTGDRWRSTRHRVLPPADDAPDEELISLIMFCEADVDAVITSLPAPIGRVEHPSVIAGEYFLERATAATIV